MSEHPEPSKLFLAYAHKDKILCDELEKHLSPLQRQGLISTWCDRMIEPGANWAQKIDEQLNKASVILLLISPDFLASDYCYGFEMSRALERHKAGTACVIPIILRPAGWQETPLGSLQALPLEGKPVTSWPSFPYDEAFQQVIEGIRRAVLFFCPSLLIVSSSLYQPLVTRLTSDLKVRSIIPWPHQREPEYDLQISQEETMHREMRTASAFLLITSPDSYHSRFFNKQLELAAIYQRAVIILWIQGNSQDEPIPEKWSNEYVIDARKVSSYEEMLQKILIQIQPHENLELSLRKPEAISEPRNPYKGLQAFRGEDTRDFFGRGQLVQTLVDVIKQSLGREQSNKSGSRLHAVVGPSGSGKSSVVMAGLLPALQNGALIGSQEWLYLEPITPGVHPLEALTITFSRQLRDRNFISLRQDLDSDSARGLHLLSCSLIKRPRTQQVILLIDQFEELFTQTTSELERQQFIDLLITAVTEPQGALIVILTLRADFSDRPMHYPVLHRLIEMYQTSVLPMDIHDLQAVIENPAQLPDVQLTFQDTLIGDLLFEMRGQIGALPLLQFTLDRLFQQRSGNLLTTRSYHDIGGIKGALLKYAQETYESLSSKEQDLARALFLRLIDPGIAGQDTTRRRATLSEVSFLDVEKTNMMLEVAETFVKARLLTTNEVAGTTTIEVSHEAIIQEWQLLEDWISQSRDDIRLQHIISKDAATWEHNKFPKDRLYRGTQLEEARAWAKRNTLNKQEQGFLRASAAMRMRTLIALVAVIFLVVTSSGIAGWFLLNQPPNPTYVTTLNDAGTGSLRWCLNNLSPGKTMITFDPDLKGSIELVSGDLVINANVNIQGPGADVVAITSKQGFGLFIGAKVSVVLSGLGIKQVASSDHAALVNAGHLSLDHVTIANNRTSGIDNIGQMKLSYVTISNNTTPSTPSVYSYPSGPYISGGIYNHGGKDSQMTLSHVAISNNTSYENDGSGGIYNLSAIMDLSDVAIIGNTSTGPSSSSGGGIYNLGGIMHLSHVTIADNVVSAPFSSGGIYNDRGEMTLVNVTITGNFFCSPNICKHDYTGDGTIEINEVQSYPASFASGGISDIGGRVYLIYCTITDNKTIKDDNSSVLLQNAPGRNREEKNYVGQIEMQNTIVVANHVQTEIRIASSSLVSYGYNLIQSTGKPFPKAVGDTFIQDAPSLFEKKLHFNHGGVMQTVIPLRTSPSNPAYNVIPPKFCLTSNIPDDQRRMPRPGKGKVRCDIGAYESQQ